MRTKNEYNPCKKKHEHGRLGTIIFFETLKIMDKNLRKLNLKNC